MFSPHTWGCTYQTESSTESPTVFPTHVGVYLSLILMVTRAKRFPHTRGGVPNIWGSSPTILTFSPHTWGCTLKPLTDAFGGLVFPTHVGVYLILTRFSACGLGFPHTRGGVPSSVSSTASSAWFSPHTWGCTWTLVFMNF